MLQLILFRAMQGVGAGCLLPVAQTIVADLYTLEQRAKLSAVMSAVFGFSSVIGPLIGGFLTDQLSWRWVFYVNLPIGIAAIVLVQAVMVEPLTDRHRHRIDWLGVCTLLGWTVLLVFALEMGGRDYAWGSPVIVGALATSVVLFVAFVVAERQRHGAADPAQPLPRARAAGRERHQRAARDGDVRDHLVPAALRGRGAAVVRHRCRAGPHTDDAGLGDRFGDRRAGRAPDRLSADVRGVLRVPAVGHDPPDPTVGIDSSQFDVSIAMVCVGIGMGFGFIATTLAAQNSVDLPRMGVATGLVNFTRQLGGVFGVAIGAALMLTTLTDRLTQALPARAHQGLRAALTAGGGPLPGRDPGPRAERVRGRPARRVRRRAW